MNEPVTGWPEAVARDVLHQDLADALRHAAVDLAVQQHRVEHRADIVDHGVARDLHRAGLAIDLDFADMASVRIVLHVGAIDRGRGQTAFHVLRQFCRVRRGPRDLPHGQCPVGLRAGENSLREVDVGDIDAEQMGGKRLRLGGDLFDRAVECRSGERRRARASRSLAEKDLVGVALHVLRLIGMNAEAVADELLEHGLVALALRDASGKQRDRARTVEAHLGALESERAGTLDRIGNAQAAQLAALARLRAALGEPRDVGASHPLVEDLFEFAAVIGEGQPGLERHRLGRNEIAPAQLGRIDAGLVGGEIDQPLDHIGGFRTAVAAIGPHRVGVRVHGRDIGMDRGRAIDPGERAQIVEEVRRAGLQVRAHVGDGLHPHAEERAVLVERKLGVGDVVARLGVAEKGLRARALPFDRTAGELRSEQHQRRLVEDRRLHPEAAADVAGDDVHLALRDLQHLLCEIRAERVHALRLGIERVVAAGRVVVADAAARLHRHGSDAADLEAMADDVVRAREGRVRRRLVAREVNEADVVGAILPHARRAAAPSRRRSR